MEHLIKYFNIKNANKEGVRKAVEKTLRDVKGKSKKDLKEA